VSYTKPQSDQLLTRLEQHLAQAPDFTLEDKAALHAMAQAWRGWIALGRASKWIITGLGLVAAAVASWSVLTGALRDWLRL
jgi:hypothetical protein